MLSSHCPATFYPTQPFQQPEKTICHEVSFDSRTQAVHGWISPLPTHQASDYNVKVRSTRNQLILIAPIISEVELRKPSKTIHISTKLSHNNPDLFWSVLGNAYVLRKSTPG